MGSNHAQILSFIKICKKWFADQPKYNVIEKREEEEEEIIISLNIWFIFLPK